MLYPNEIGFEPAQEVLGTDHLPQTGVVTLRLISEEHAEACQTDASIRVQNARVLMKNGFIRVIVDKWGVLKTADSPLEFDVKTDKDVSATKRHGG